MKDIVIIICFLISFFLLSCEKKECTYYDTGELRSEEVFFSDNTSVTKEYYKNGNLFRLFHFKDSCADGSGEIYFEDGTLMWRGTYVNGYVERKKIREEEIQFLRYHIDIKPKNNLHVGDTIKLRFTIEGVHPHFYRITVSNNAVIEENKSDYYNYPFIVIPQKPGEMYVYAHIENDSGKIIISDDKRTLTSNVLNVLP